MSVRPKKRSTLEPELRCQGTVPEAVGGRSGDLFIYLIGDVSVAIYLSLLNLACLYSILIVPL